MGGLRYRGTDPNQQFIAGVPARDLSADEAAAHAVARRSPLYEAIADEEPSETARRRTRSGREDGA